MRWVCVIAILVLATGCANYVKRDEFDTTINDLRATDAVLADGLDGFRGQFTEMTRDLSAQFNEYDVTLANLQGRLRVDLSAHFEFDDDTLRDEDKSGLDEFSSVITPYDPNVVVTVEGFTDSIGNAAYNQSLGMRRAQAVADYLISVGGLHPERVRAVSYGEDERRQLDTGTGDDDGANRRVSLVVDYIGPTPSR